MNAIFTSPGPWDITTACSKSTLLQPLLEGTSEGVMAFCRGVALGKGQRAVGFAEAC